MARRNPRNSTKVYTASTALDTRQNLPRFPPPDRSATLARRLLGEGTVFATNEQTNNGRRGTAPPPSRYEAVANTTPGAHPFRRYAMSVRISDLVDRLGELRAQKSSIEKEAGILTDTVRRLLTNRKTRRMTGERFVATLEAQERTDTSIARIKQVFGEGAADRLGKKAVEMVKTAARAEVTQKIQSAAKAEPGGLPPQGAAPNGPDYREKELPMDQTTET